MVAEMMIKALVLNQGWGLYWQQFQVLPLAVAR